MLRKSIHKLHDVKVFSQNHEKHELTLKSFSKKSGVEYKVRLSKDELNKVVEFIEQNMFKDI
ncbi:hypothetical protein [Cetobacterium sp.]|uniref:hypothetical protein n=1 Tax=Cetobacterium sp. TaxID=2071632 RepID=UPI003F3A3EDA